MSDLNKNNLPVGWEIDDYANIVTTISTNGKKVNQKQYEVSGKYPVIDQGKEDCSGYCNDEEKVIDANFPILVFGDHTRAVKSINNPFVAGADGVKVLQPSGAITPKLLFYFTQYLAISIKDKGYARHYQWVAKELIGIPPENEQIRIVEKIEELFSELDKGIESLKTAKAQLAVYRQALLKHAFEGKLTEEWRKDNADKLESPEQLLQHIQQEREARYQEQFDDWEKEVEKWLANGKEGKKPAKPRIPKSIVSIDGIDMAGAPGLPDDWTWVTLDMLISGLPRAMQSGPFGSNLKHSEFQESGVLVLGIDNVKSGDFSLGSQNRISETKYKELEKYTARPGDLLVTVMASLGRSCVVPRELEKAIITKHVYRISMEQKLLLPEFYNLILQSHTISRTRMFENAQGQTRPGLNSTILRELPMPLCCIEEQKEIFNILGEKLSIVAKLEEEIDSNIERSSLLRQSILKKAFSGQLVSQDPNDEPASELLKKIEIEKAELAEKEKAEKAAARKSKSKAKSAAKK
ncbi:restriction endonuclease subunit S [Pseudoalteromonas sp. MMG007]|uniref:restriction endonuclease subunit S n=1 Tax=Pseudoalteromonas sp. MMG007 TaxID=2822684 RepID=UPI001B394FB8|nr:restriction endonuclease subunit S [Pseudoalteromonas sp. MMG007]